MTAYLAWGTAFFALAAMFAVGAVRNGSREKLAIARGLAIVGAAYHVFLLAVLGASSGRFPVTGAFESFVFLAGAVMIAALCLDWLRKLPILTVATLPLATLTSLLALALAAGPAEPHAPPGSSGIWTGLHVLVALGAYMAFALAFLTGILYLLAQRRLKEHASTPLLGLMPSLETILRLNSRAIAIGVLFLAVGTVVGYLQARAVYGIVPGWRHDPKIWLTTITLAAYAALLALCRRPAFKGRRTALASVAGFFLVMATFWASVFWSDIHRFR